MFFKINHICLSSDSFFLNKKKIKGTKLKLIFKCKLAYGSIFIYLFVKNTDYSYLFVPILL